jgi:hypothetical protein
MQTRDTDKDQRRELAEELAGVDSAEAMWAFQRNLADRIREAERLQKECRQPQTEWHLHLLRVIGDSLAWTVLHGHTIRQLAKNAGRPPWLIDQGRAFDDTLAMAERAAKRGMPVLVADLTNCIRIGDLILCGDPEHPGIVECKSGKARPVFEHQGRKGRQLRRMQRTSRYLKDGAWADDSTGKTLLTVPTSVQPVYNWWAVTRAANTALTSGIASCLISPDELLLAYSGEGSVDAIEEEVAKSGFDSKGATVGLHMVPIEAASPDVPPPLVWEIPNHLRFPLLEGDVVLVHLLQRRTFLRRLSDAVTVVDIDVVTEHSEDLAYKVRVGEAETVCSSNFTKRVLYRFETVESVALAMSELATRALEKLKGIEDATGGAQPEAGDNN